jgi:hypothetical protein
MHSFPQGHSAWKIIVVFFSLEKAEVYNKNVK